MNTVPDRSDCTPVSADEVDWAIRNIGHKASGLDGMTSHTMKCPTLRATLVNKLSKAFTRWLQDGMLPPYIARSRLILLSKEATNFPTVGAIRPISILPIIDKVLQKVIYFRLNEGPD